MKRKLIIDGNAVYEIDEECMVKRRLNDNKKTDEEKTQDNKRYQNQMDTSFEN